MDQLLLHFSNNMASNKLSQSARDIIQSYLRLPFDNKVVSCPYFNNKRARVRGGLRVLIGKGTHHEITEEAKILAKRHNVDLESLSDKDIKKFLVEHNIGIDCSGFTFHILDAELRARSKGTLKQQLSFPHIKSPLRKFLAKFRTIENTNVVTLSQEENSVEIPLADIAPADMIIILSSEKFSNPNHVLIVHEVNTNGSLQEIHYTHSFEWRTDGAANHGVRQGTISITYPSKNLLSQHWEEQGKTGENNETYLLAKNASNIQIRRLKALV